MRVANTVDLKNKTNELVRWAMAGEPVIITLRGKPAAALTPLTESDLESFVLRYAQAKTTRPRRAEEMIRYTTVGSDLGTIYVAYSEQGVCAVDVGTSGEAFARAVHRKSQRPVEQDLHPPQTLRQNLRQFVGALDSFRGPVDLSMVGPFERLVLERLRRIPKGQVRTYGDIAREIGYPGAARAVGNACAKNPVPLLVPCHRVVRSDGGLGGYSLRGGPALKRRLLAQEGVDMREVRAS
ncbi:MAG TPA: type II toxin-antitoxin system prevent-host-death family antitoxin [bacterium]